MHSMHKKYSRAQFEQSEQLKGSIELCSRFTIVFRLIGASIHPLFFLFLPFAHYVRSSGWKSYGVQHGIETVETTTLKYQQRQTW